MTSRDANQSRGNLFQEVVTSFEEYHQLPDTNLQMCLACGRYMIAFLLAYQMYGLLFRPLNRIKRIGDVGYLYHQSGNISKRDKVNLLRQKRKLGENLPPVYPNGWFRLLDSLELKVGQVKEVTALGEHFAVYRGKSGKAHILDAYCPHMGSNMAQGGRVEGDCLECPFHGWAFSGSGKCTKIPYAKKIPSIAKANSWACRELNGNIFVWYHCDRLKPQWEIPEVEEMTNNSLWYRGRTEHHINCHIQDIPENGHDMGHVTHLHEPFSLAGADLSKASDSWRNVAQHKYEVSYMPIDSRTKHISQFVLLHKLFLLGKWPAFSISLNIQQIGPGLSVYHIESFLGKAVIVNCITPCEPMLQIMTHAMYTTWKFPTWAAKIFLYLDAIQVDRDVLIWNNKTFLKNPILVSEEKSIARYRRWFSQFYSPNSPRLNDLKQDLSW